jgi:hypothetical protein
VDAPHSASAVKKSGKVWNDSQLTRPLGHRNGSLYFVFHSLGKENKILQFKHTYTVILERPYFECIVRYMIRQQSPLRQPQSPFIAYVRRRLHLLFPSVHERPHACPHSSSPRRWRGLIQRCASLFLIRTIPHQYPNHKPRPHCAPRRSSTLQI